VLGDLADRLKPCGPIYDPRAAERVLAILSAAAEAEGWSARLHGAWPALAPAAGAAPYLAGLMRKDPARLGRILASAPDAALESILSRARLEASLPAEADEAKARLRNLKGELHLLTALCDLGGLWDLKAVTGALTAFADEAVRAAVAIAAQVEIARGRLIAPGPDADRQGGPAPGWFCVALGKHGAYELNYSSDIDISIFYDPGRLKAAEGQDPHRLAQRLVQGLVDVLQSRTAEGYVFRVDLRLRPDPSSTQAAVPMEAALEYYEAVGQNWERAALIKARLAAGDLTLGGAFLSALKPFIWRRYLDYAAISDIHAIKRQIHAHQADERLTAPGANLKLGAGGIREIEFFVQTQQLIHGGRNPDLRCASTLDALAALSNAGHVTRAAERDLAASYDRLRALEHRVQMVNDEQTHILPEASPERQRIACLSGAADLRTFDAGVSAVLRRVNGRYGALFAEDEPLSSSFGNLVFTGVEDDPETLLTLKRMGFSNPALVSGLIRAWHHGRIAATRTQRGREILTRFAPRLLEAAHASGAPDAAFNRFADFFGRLSSGVQIQSLFLAEPKLLRLIVEVMAFAPRLAATLGRQPAALDALLDGGFFSAVDAEETAKVLKDAVDAASDFEAAMDAARRAHREAAFRIGVRILSGTLSAEDAGRAFAALADACVQVLARQALGEVARVGGRFDGEVAVVALGKAGSREMSAGSDLDLMTLYATRTPDAVSEIKGWSAETFFARFTQRLVAALSAPTGEGAIYRVDLQLRPSGTAGPVAVSLPAFKSYYAGEAETWEYLALTRARVIWASSDAFTAAASAAIEAALRRARDAAGAAKDVREMRALMRKEHVSKGVWDLKHADGGLVDIEFAAQYLQIVNAAAGGPLEVNTADALAALAACRLAPQRRLAALRRAWRLQHALNQVLKVALADGDAPDDEAPRFHELLARAAGSEDLPSVRRMLKKLQAGAHEAFVSILAPAPTAKI